MKYEGSLCIIGTTLCLRQLIAYGEYDFKIIDELCSDHKDCDIIFNMDSGVKLRFLKVEDLDIIKDVLLNYINKQTVIEIIK